MLISLNLPMYSHFPFVFIEARAGEHWEEKDRKMRKTFHSANEDRTNCPFFCHTLVLTVELSVKIRNNEALASISPSNRQAASQGKTGLDNSNRIKLESGEKLEPILLLSLCSFQRRLRSLTDERHI